MNNNFFFFENNGALSLFEDTPLQTVTTENSVVWNQLEKKKAMFFDRNGNRIERPIKKRKKKISILECF